MTAADHVAIHPAAPGAEDVEELMSASAASSEGTEDVTNEEAAEVLAEVRAEARSEEARSTEPADVVRFDAPLNAVRKQEPVSEPTDAEVEAAFKSWNGWHVGTVRDRLRAALEAARAVTNGDET